MAEFTTEGLNSLKYEVKSIEKKVLYTRILVELKTDTVSIHYQHFSSYFQTHFFLCSFSFFMFAVKKQCVDTRGPMPI